jgi:YHYH protein
MRCRSRARDRGNCQRRRVAFLDSCNGHPTPMGDYHYHALPPCVTAMVDTVGGPSHIIGVAFDGYPIYGDRGIDGRQITAAQLDRCSGMTSATPEFPRGVYHYVLLRSTDATSSIRCFAGIVALARRRMPGMMHP